MENICAILHPYYGLLAHLVWPEGAPSHTEVELYKAKKWINGANKFVDFVLEGRSADGVTELHDEALRCYMAALYCTQQDRNDKSADELTGFLESQLGESVLAQLLDQWVCKCEIMREGKVPRRCQHTAFG